MSGEPEFVDTNIVVYAHDRTAGEKRSIAGSLLQRLDDGRNGAVSVQVLQEFAVIAGVKTRPPLPDRQLREIIEDLSDWIVFCPGPADVIEALGLKSRFQISFWDAMILQAAREVGATVLWTEDLGHGQEYDDVLVRNPFREPFEPAPALRG